MSRYRALDDGERRVLPGKRGVVWNRMRCCSCALVHLIRYRIVGSSLELTAWRDRKATRAARKRKGLRWKR